MRLKNLQTFIGIDWFIPALLCMVALAYYFPGPGNIKQPLSLAEIASYGVSGIFFFYGLKLNRQKLNAGLTNWRMHILIQATTFILFPLLIILIKPFFNTSNSEPLWAGIFFLAALPSTVSSSVVMVSLAGGNIPAAIFNASISALIGVFLTPLWIALILNTSVGNFDITTITLNLTLQVLVPVLIGISLNKHFGYMAEKHKKTLKNFDQVIILLIVYTSFCKSFTEHLFEGMKMIELIFLAAGMLTLFLIVMLITKAVCKVFNFKREDTITVIFCGSKKSLVHGTVMSGILFAGSSLAGFILLPLMLYHAIQLVTSSFIAKRMSAPDN